jgi:predicted transcriptional regulator
MTRYTVDLGPEYDEALASMARNKGGSKSEVIRRALIAYTALKDEEKSGNKVSITGQVGDDGQSKILKDVILP